MNAPLYSTLTTVALRRGLNVRSGSRGDETEPRPALTLSPRQQTEWCAAANRRSVPIAASLNFCSQ